MAKAKKKKTSKPKGPKQVMQSRQLDAPATAYAKLLSNPCGGALAAPLYVASSTGYLLRVERDFVVATGAADTCHVGHFVPGNFTNITTCAGSCMIATPATDSSAVNLTNYQVGQPGGGSLGSLCNRYRAVAGCVQIMYLGTELTRSGVLAMGHACPYDISGSGTNGSSYNATITAAQLRTFATHVTRTPDGVVELKWVPNASAEVWSDPNSGNFSFANNNNNGIFWSASGLAAASGLRIRLVAVYEYQPSASADLSSTQGSVPRSRYTWADVLAAMGDVGRWAYSIGQTGAMQSVGRYVIGAAPMVPMLTL